jgi:superfamily II DNA/RNA helicase
MPRGHFEEELKELKARFPLGITLAEADELLDRFFLSDVEEMIEDAHWHEYIKGEV